MHNRVRLAVPTLLAILAIRGHAQGRGAPPPPPRPPSNAALAATIDSVVRTDFLAQGAPSVSVVITRGNQTLLERAWGMADVAGRRPATPSTTYRIGSNSKQVTAALVLKLVERGKLSLSDTLGLYLSGLRPQWRAIRIEHLLNHTSGLPTDYLESLRFRLSERVPAAALVAMAAADSLLSPPGARHLYSNTGYMLLSVLIEKLYGKPYATVVRDEIARPLGLTSLASCDAVPADHAASAYRWSKDSASSPTTARDPSQLLGAGALCATAADFAKWMQALHGGRVLSAASYAAMTSPRGAAIPEHYGFGLWAEPAPWGNPALFHGGSTPGYIAETSWYPAESLAVIVFYNTFPRIARTAANTIAALSLGYSPKLLLAAATPRTAAASFSADQAREKFVGEYELVPGRVATVAYDGGSFWLTPPGSTQRLPMVRDEGATFAIGTTGAVATFLADDDGRVVELLIRQNDTDRRLRKIK